MSEEKEEEVPRRLRRFYRENPEGAGPEEQADVFSKPLPYKREKPEREKAEKVPEVEQEEQAETIYREQESEEKEIDWDKKRTEALEKMRGQLTSQKVQEFRQRHNRLPEGSEEEEIARSVFGQLQKEEEKMKADEKRNRIEKRNPKEGGAEKARKGEKEATGFRGRREKIASQKAVPETEAAQNEIEIKGSEAFDLMKDEPQKKAKQKAKPQGAEGEEELGELEEVGEETEGEEEEEKEKATGAKSCPNCKKETETTTFCPECGSEFCDNCAAPKRIAGKLKYKCPKCGYEFSRAG